MQLILRLFGEPCIAHSDHSPNGREHAKRVQSQTLDWTRIFDCYLTTEGKERGANYDLWYTLLLQSIRNRTASQARLLPLAKLRNCDMLCHGRVSQNWHSFRKTFKDGIEIDLYIFPSSCPCTWKVGWRWSMSSLPRTYSPEKQNVQGLAKRWAQSWMNFNPAIA